MADTQTNNFQFILPEPNGSVDTWGEKLNLNWSAVDTLIKSIQNSVTVAMPTGAVQTFAMSDAPSGWLKCNGQAVSRVTYVNLYNAIGTTYGAGNGSTTFNLPDLRGEFVRGWDDGRGVDSGRGFGTNQNDAFESHNHGNGEACDVTAEAMYGVKSGPTVGRVDQSSAESKNQQAITETVGSSETRPRNVSLLYCIKT